MIVINNKEIEQTLKAIKTKIERSREDLAEAKGQKKALLSSLKKDFGLDNFIDAEQMVKKLTKELTILSSDIEEKYEKLKTDFGLI